MSAIKANQWLNPDGTENFKCRAWVNFNGTGTVAIRAAGNVSSITDNTVGDFTINFATPMPDANYAYSGNHSSASVYVSTLVLNGAGITPPTTLAARISTAVSGAYADPSSVNLSFFR